ncbi:hypothetical protein [Rhizobium sp. A37_96]
MALSALQALDFASVLIVKPLRKPQDDALAHSVFLAIRSMPVEKAQIADHEVRRLFKIEAITTADEMPMRNPRKILQPCKRRKTLAFLRRDDRAMRLFRDDKNVACHDRSSFLLG